MGTNHVDNSARLCHAASTVAMRRDARLRRHDLLVHRLAGHATSSCSSARTRQQPAGDDEVPLPRAPAGPESPSSTPTSSRGCARYWVPSVPESALFGTRFADDWFAVDTGGDLAFLNGVLKVLVEMDWLDQEFVARTTVGFEGVEARAARAEWSVLERESGASRAEISRFARMLAQARNAVLVWSMGLTQHAHGVPTIQALLNVGLARGCVGREKTGLMPIRGHSGVQGGAEVGCAPSLDDAQRRASRRPGGSRCRPSPGLTAVRDDGRRVRRRARRRSGSWAATSSRRCPTRPRSRAPCAAWRTRIHQDIVLTSMMLVPPEGRGRALPGHHALRVARRRDRDVHRAPHHLLPGDRRAPHRLGQAGVGGVRRGGGARAAGSRGPVRLRSSQQIRDEIARTIPLYAGIETLGRPGRPVPVGRHAACSPTAASRRRTARRISRWSSRPSGRARTARSTSPPAAASSSTRWCSTRSTRSPAPRATTC